MGFRKGQGTRDAIFQLRMINEIYKSGYIPEDFRMSVFAHLL